MANSELHAITRVANIKVDIGNSERDLDRLSKKFRELNKQVSIFSKLQGRDFGSFSKSSQYRMAKVTGLTRSELASMNKRELATRASDATAKSEEIKNKLLTTQGTLQKKINNLLVAESDVTSAIRKNREKIYKKGSRSDWDPKTRIRHRNIAENLEDFEKEIVKAHFLKMKYP